MITICVESAPAGSGRTKTMSVQGWPVTATWGVSFLPSPEKSDWSVTHLPTGRYVYSTMSTQRAVNCAAALGAVYDLPIGSPGSLPSFGGAAAALKAVVDRFIEEDKAQPVPKDASKAALDESASSQSWRAPIDGPRPVVYVATPWRVTPGGPTRTERTAYAESAIRDSLVRGEAPIAPHVMYRDALVDEWPDHRKAGMDAGLAILHVCDRLVVYEDYGISEGMHAEIEAAREAGMVIDYRSIGFVRVTTTPVYGVDGASLERKTVEP